MNWDATRATKSSLWATIQELFWLHLLDYSVTDRSMRTNLIPVIWYRAVMHADFHKAFGNCCDPTFTSSGYAVNERVFFRTIILSSEHFKLEKRIVIYRPFWFVAGFAESVLSIFKSHNRL
jgi:hypothetical protein